MCHIANYIIAASAIIVVKYSMKLHSEDVAIREQLAAFLKCGHAHMTFEEAVKDFPLDRINEKAPNSDYTPYRLLEHMRITQWDILDFIRNPEYKYIKWPDDYWPKEGYKASDKDWKKSIKLFKSDTEDLISFLMNPETDLYRTIPHGTGQTVLKEALVVIDHNSNHIGEFGILRSVMKTWK